ncbi:MAG: hypothetical protein JRD89_02745 [Deltaproteobacteria bacterium]|nr:hypothetical protein [Deltaproteobacteria bacterium]
MDTLVLIACIALGLPIWVVVSAYAIAAGGKVLVSLLGNAAELQDAIRSQAARIGNKKE